jgi:hypothetical protein
MCFLRKDEDPGVPKEALGNNDTWWLFVPQPKKDKEWLTKGGRRSESEDAK